MPERLTATVPKLIMEWGPPASPAEDNVVQAEKLLDKMIKIQKQHLGYLN